MKNVYGAIVAISDEVIASKELLTELDREIGDADHGINMARGFEAVKETISKEEKNISVTLKKVGMTLISKVGGASGPLYGTAFMRAAKVEAGEELNLENFISMLEEALGGIQHRGKATTGEKTMLDAIVPALDSLKKSKDDGIEFLNALDIACTEAQKGVEYTKTIKATKGRASYLGDRSIGHQDPGATSFLIILSALNKYLSD